MTRANTALSRLVWLSWAGPTAFAVAYFALWACNISKVSAPLYTLPTPVRPPADLPYQFGFGGGGAIRIPACPPEYAASCPALVPELQAFYRRSWRRGELSLVVNGGPFTVFGAGLQGRVFPLSSDAARLGVSGSLGIGGVQLGAPLAGRLAPGNWVFIEPTLTQGFGGGRLLQLPLGYEFHVPDHDRSVSLQAGVATQNFGAALGYGALGLAAS